MSEINMDNFKLELVSRGINSMKAAMSIVFSTHSGKTIGWKEIEVNEKSDIPDFFGKPKLPHKVLVFYWTDDKDVNKFPIELNSEEAAIMAMKWIEDKAIYGPQPDHDGDNVKAFYMFTDNWGHVLNDWRALVGIGPAWAMLGK